MILGLGSLAGDRTHAATGLIGGPYGRLLAEAVDLGPARVDRVQLTAALGRAARPVELTDWAAARGLSVRWRDGDAWAIIEGPPGAVAGSFTVAVHDYRPRGGPDGGDVFYASPYQPEIPEAARAERAGELLKPGDWNRIRVEARGDTFTVWLNGEQVSRYSDQKYSGPAPIGLQIHAGLPMKVEFRDLRATAL